MQTKRKPFSGSFIALLLAVGGGTFAGCGEGPSRSSSPSDSDISDAVKHYCEKAGVSGMCNYIKLPDRPAVAGLLNYGDQITISDVRVVKRGEPYDRGFGANPTKGFPVRVDFKGMRIASYGKMVGSMGEIVHDKDVNLPFEGQTDFDIERQPADRTKVDPGPGKWIASPAK